jgi:hypothetical protein
VVSIRTQPDSRATASVADSRFRLWARRRARQLLWVVSFLAVALVVTAAGFMLSRATRLIGLPDVGDPFDVAAFRAANALPEAQDAVVLIRKAAALAKEPPALPQAVRQVGKTGWSQVDPKLRDWLAANRAALALYRQGAERPEGIMNHGTWTPIDYRFLNIGPFVLLALLEGSRLEDQGDMEGAWKCYRTILRIRALVTRRGSVFQRFWVDRRCESVQQRIEAWAADPRTAAALLRRALDDVKACEPKPEWDTYSLKVEYLVMISELDAPDGEIKRGSYRDLNYQIADMKLSPELSSHLYAAQRFIKNEPELSRRVLRLAFANWLARAQGSDPQNRTPSVVADSGQSRGWNTSIPFFTPGPNAPDSARRMPLDQLASRLLTTHDALELLENWPWWWTRISEKRAHAGLVMLLAEALYRRDHGTPPPNDGALVGPYLDRLPDDGSDNLPDGRARRVRPSTGLELEPEDNRQ